VTPPGRYPDDFFIAKDFCAYTTIILRQEKILRDHGERFAHEGAFAQDNSKKRVGA
jgi:hypothetical protein